MADKEAQSWRLKLADWQLGAAEVGGVKESIARRVFTPGMSAGEPLHVLSALEHPSPFWQTDVEAARESLSASTSCSCDSSDAIPIPRAVAIMSS